MTPKQRIRLVMSGKQPDRVPAMCQLSIGHQIINSKISPAEIWFSAEGFAEALIRTREMYQFDGVLVNLTHRDGWLNEVLEIKETDKAEVVYWKNGAKAVCPYKENMYWIPARIIDPPSLEDVDPDSLDVHLITPEETRVTRILAERIGKMYSIHGEVSSPFNSLIIIFGIEQAMLGLLDYPEKCKAIIEHHVKASLSHAVAHISCGADAIVISSPFVGQGFISKKAYREFELPYLKKLVSEIHLQRPDIPVYVHTCGLLNDRLEDLVESGVDGIECLDPAPLGNVELEDAKKRIGNKVFIKGNIDSVNTLLRKDESGVIENIHHCIDIGMPGGKYILSTSCSVAPDVPPSKVKLIAELAQEYGVYS